MGQVFAAVDVASGRQVAIKTVVLKDEASLAYFDHEIATLASLNHPAIVPIRDHGVFEGRPWYAMDWLEGPTLRSLLGRLTGVSVDATAIAEATAYTDRPTPSDADGCSECTGRTTSCSRNFASSVRPDPARPRLRACKGHHSRRSEAREHLRSPGATARARGFWNFTRLRGQSRVVKYLAAGDR